MKTSAKIKIPGIKHFDLFGDEVVTRDKIIDHIKQWKSSHYPGVYVVGLLLRLNDTLRFAPITLIDIEPNVTHYFCVRAHETADACKELPNSELEVSVHGPYMTNSGPKYFGLYWLGKRPDVEIVFKKIKEYGGHL